MDWKSLGFLLAALLIGWLLYYFITRSRDTFTKENFSKTATTLGLLALILIAFIGFCFMWLKGQI